VLYAEDSLVYWSYLRNEIIKLITELMKTLFRIIVIGFLLLPTMLVAQNKKIASPLLAGKHVNKKIISTEKAPGAIGPYSQGITAGGFLFTSGQLPINPKTGEVSSSIEEQTRQVLDNIKAIVEAAGISLENVIKTTVYIQHMSDFDAVNKIYSTYFPNNPPARACVEVSKIAKNALVEIEAVAVIN